MPQLQKAMPVAAAPVRKFLRVVIYILPEKPRFPFGRSIAAGLFLISSPGTLPSRSREGNDSRNN
jgi:hypothetical protein